MNTFVTFTILGLVLGSVYAIAASRAGTHVQHVRHLQLRARCTGNARCVHLLAVALRLGTSHFRRLADFTRPGRATDGPRPLRPDHEGSARYRRGHQNRCDGLDPARNALDLALVLAPRDRSDDADVLRRPVQDHGVRREHPLPRVDLHPRCDRHRRRPAHPVHAHPRRCRDARRRRRSGTVAPQRPQSGASCGPVLGDGFDARSPGRHPDHPDQWRHTRGEHVDTLGDRRVCRGHVRPVAQHSAHVRRRPWSSGLPVRTYWRTSRRVGVGRRISVSPCR